MTPHLSLSMDYSAGSPCLRAGVWEVRRCSWGMSFTSESGHISPGGRLPCARSAPTPSCRPPPGPRLVVPGTDTPTHRGVDVRLQWRPARPEAPRGARADLVLFG